MDPTLRMVIGIAMRWVHIASVITLLGSFIFARFALAPAAASLPGGDRKLLGENIARSFRGLLYTVVATAFLSGLYNYLTKPVYPPGYHMWFGIKFLFVLHIFAVSILYASPNADDAKRSKWASGIVISG